MTVLIFEERYLAWKEGRYSSTVAPAAAAAAAVGGERRDSSRACSEFQDTNLVHWKSLYATTSVFFQRQAAAYIEISFYPPEKGDCRGYQGNDEKAN